MTDSGSGGADETSWGSAGPAKSDPGKIGAGKTGHWKTGRAKAGQHKSPSLDTAKRDLAALAAEAAAVQAPGDRDLGNTSQTLSIGPGGAATASAKPVYDPGRSTSTSLVPTKGPGAEHLPVLSGITMFGQVVTPKTDKDRRSAASRRGRRVSAKGNSGDDRTRLSKRGAKLGPGSGNGLIIAWAILGLLVVGLIAVTVLLINAA